jgi:hypothetical protein
VSFRVLGNELTAVLASAGAARRPRPSGMMTKKPKTPK